MKNGFLRGCLFHQSVNESMNWQLNPCQITCYFNHFTHIKALPIP